MVGRVACIPVVVDDTHCCYCGCGRWFRVRVGIVYGVGRWVRMEERYSAPIVVLYLLVLLLPPILVERVVAVVVVLGVNHWDYSNYNNSVPMV